MPGSCRTTCRCSWNSCRPVAGQDIHNWLADIHHILGLLAERLHQRESGYQVLFEVLLTLAGQAPDRRELAASRRR